MILRIVIRLAGVSRQLSQISRAACAGLACATLLPALCGCASVTRNEIILGPSYQPKNVSSQNEALPEEFRRVAVLPLYGPSDETREPMQQVILVELANTKRFEAVHITREQLRAWTGRDQWSAADVLPQTLLARLREQLHCDGVMLPELTLYHAYPPLRLGWRITLIEAEAGRAIWAADEVFDATDPAVVNGARRFYTGYRAVHNVAPDSRFILLSPTAFGHYTARTLFEALPAPQAAKFLPVPADKPIVVRSAS